MDTRVSLAEVCLVLDLFLLRLARSRIEVEPISER